MTDIRITILGSGSMMPTKQRNPSGFLVEIANKKILLDCGQGIIRRLVDYNFNLHDIDLIFVSHFHTDHFADAFSLIHSRWVDDMSSSRKHKKLLFLGPKNIGVNFKSWRKIFWPEPQEHYPLEFREGEGKYSLSDIKIETFVVKHVKWFQSIGIIIKYHGKKLVYTGDIGSDNDFNYLIKRIHGADLLITEAAALKTTPNHFTIAQATELKLKARVKQVLPVHFRSQTEKEIKLILKKIPGFIIKKDGDRITI